MTIQQNVSLSHLNTLGLEVMARYFCSVTSLEQLSYAVKFAKSNHLRILPIGDGSNLVLPKELNAMVIHIALKGMYIRNKDKKNKLVTVAAGENWHDFIGWTLTQKAHGLENLSLIPGTVGATPIQNVGAYGVETANYLYEVLVYNYESEQSITFDTKACCFNYRDSLFKTNPQYIILSVTFALDSQFTPILTHEILKQRLQSFNQPITAQNVRDTVCTIRQEKLPNPSQIANVGSFFKNPIISEDYIEQIKKIYKEIPCYQSNAQWKLSAGWLIEKTGLKNKRNGPVGLYEKHALVLVNYANASQTQVIDFAKYIQNEVTKKFNIILEIEPTIINTTPTTYITKT